MAGEPVQPPRYSPGFVALAGVLMLPLHMCFAIDAAKLNLVSKYGNPQSESHPIETLNLAYLRTETFQQMTISVTGLGIYDGKVNHYFTN